MEIKILAHGNTSPEKVMLLHKIAKFYAKYLNVSDFKYKVYICLAPNMRYKDGNNGVCALTGHRELTIALDSGLPLAKAMQTLAHEMVHVKQYVRGHYRAELSKNGRMRRFWLGKQYIVPYMKRPWEIEAFSRELELVTELIKSVAQKSKKHV